MSDSPLYQRAANRGEAAAKFLEMAREDYSVPLFDEGTGRTRNHRTSGELGQAMLYLDASGFAEELLGYRDGQPGDDGVWVCYCMAYSAVFSVHWAFPWDGLDRDSFEAKVFAAVPEPYRKMRAGYGQVPTFKPEEENKQP
jgi:hypothetical protein